MATETTIQSRVTTMAIPANKTIMATAETFALRSRAAETSPPQAL